MPDDPAAGRRRSYHTALLVVAVAAAGLNLRTAIAGLPPLFPDLAARLHLSSAVLSLLAAAPVICFGVASAFAAWLSRRFGEERTLFAALGVLCAGLLLRGLWPGALLFPGTILAGSAIGILNVLLSSLVKRRWPERAGLLLGIYLTGLSVGAILASLLSVPLYQASGDSVRISLGVWAGPAALAMLLWLPQLRYRALGRGAPAAPPAPAGPGRPAATSVQDEPAAPIKVHRYALSWQVMGFMGLQSLLFYAALSWLPTIFQDRGTSAVAAGNLLALMAAGNGAAGSGRALDVPARRQPGSLPRPRHLLHDSEGAGSGRGGLAVRFRAVGRLPGRQRRAARGWPAARGHRQLGHPGPAAARPCRRRYRRRHPGRPPARPAPTRGVRGGGQPPRAQGAPGGRPPGLAQPEPRHACRLRGAGHELSASPGRRLRSFVFLTRPAQDVRSSRRDLARVHQRPGGPEGTQPGPAHPASRGDTRRPDRVGAGTDGGQDQRPSRPESRRGRADHRDSPRLRLAEGQDRLRHGSPGVRAQAADRAFRAVRDAAPARRADRL